MIKVDAAAVLIESVGQHQVGFCQPQHQLRCPRGQSWPARTALLGIRPSASNQVSMPSQQRLGLDEEPTPANLGHQLAQAGEDCSVGWPQSRTLDLATQDRDLVSEHDDLDRQFVLFAPAKPEQLEYPNEGHIEEGQRRRFPQMERDPHVHEIIVQVGRARRRPTPRVLFQADVMSLRACSRGTQCLVERCPSTYPQTYPPAALCSTRSTSASGSTAWRNSSSVAQAAP